MNPEPAKIPIKYSIIIPTLNEEHYVGVLLDSLCSQTYKEFEVIVVDGHSEDKTREVVERYFEKFTLRFIEAPKRGVGFQRNFGAGKALYENLVFFDADIFIDPDFLEKLSEYIEKNNPDFLTSWFKPISIKKRDKIFFNIFNVYLEAIKFISPGSGGAFIYTKKEAFNKVGGFSEQIVLGEDFNLAKKMDRAGFTYKIVKDPCINVSVRRMDKEGRFHYTTNLLKAHLHANIYGPIKDNRKIKYEFGHYNKV